MVGHKHGPTEWEAQAPVYEAGKAQTSLVTLWQQITIASTERSFQGSMSVRRQRLPHPKTWVPRAARDRTAGRHLHHEVDVRQRKSDASVHVPRAAVRRLPKGELSPASYGELSQPATAAAPESGPRSGCEAIFTDAE